MDMSMNVNFYADTGSGTDTGKDKDTGADKDMNTIYFYVHVHIHVHVFIMPCLFQLTSLVQDKIQRLFIARKTNR